MKFSLLAALAVRFNVRQRLALGRLVVGACWLCWLAVAGCRPAAEPESTGGEPVTTPPAASLIPLRVWVAAPIGDSQTWLRQWLATSEQPLDLREVDVEELLQMSQTESDVLVYPARLVGDLLDRGWIVKLPEGSRATGDGPEAAPAAAESEQMATAVPAAWRQQATYAGEVVGVPLGCSLPVFVASDSGPSSEQPLPWKTLFESLQLQEQPTPQLDIDPDQVDRHALVDRWLAIAATLTDRDPGYGLLFDLQTMKSRLKEPHFAQAAAILAGLAGQPGGLSAVTGSHSEAWTWAATHSQPVVAIASPAMLDAQAASITRGKIIGLQVAAAEQDRPVVRAWNGGGGLLASLSSGCRQTNQAAALLGWLAEPQTRTALANFAPGIEPATPAAGTASLVWQARQSLGPILNGASLAHEPRLPRANEYRQALAEALIAFLSGAHDASQAMSAVDARWQQITAVAGGEQRRQYEQSLGLSL